MFEQSEKSTHLQTKLTAFMAEYIYPNEHAYAQQLQEAEDRFAPMPSKVNETRG